mmetsp:Transcript_24085/g.44695  ORF Transcript_24085/g.44695 Transcript_24085/m.44695 type:complete len:1004 (+) Transcript_24085:179-3190(+)
MASTDNDTEVKFPLLAASGSIEISEEVREGLKAIQVGHNLASVVNNPGGDDEGGWFGQITAFFDREDSGTELPIPSVVPDVEVSEFSSYLTKNSLVLRQFQRNHKTRAGGENGGARGRKDHPLPSHELQQKAQQHAQSESIRRTHFLTKGLAAAVELETENTATTEIETLSNDALRVCLEKVPNRFFQEDFKVSLEEDQDSTHAAYLYQEKLSNWLDLVEVTLWSQTTSQAQQFFNSISDLNQLNLQVRDTCETIAELRGHVKAVQTALVRPHLEILRKRRRMQNVKTLEALLTKIRNVRATVPVVTDIMATSNDFAGALVLLGAARNEIENELAAIHSLRTLQRQIDTLENMIVEQLGEKYIEVSGSWGDMSSFDVEEEGASVTNIEAGNENGSAEHVDESNPELTEELLPLVVGLVVAQNNPIRNALTKYRKYLLDQVRIAAKNSVVEALAAIDVEEEDNNPGKPTTPSGGANSSASKVPVASAVQLQLSALSPQRFLSFLALVFDALEMVMQRAKCVHSSLLVCLSKVEAEVEMVHERVLGSTKEQEHQVEKNQADRAYLKRAGEESSDSLAKACELAQGSVQKLLALRLKEHEKLQLYDFKQLYDKVARFSLRAERLSNPNTSIELKGALRLSAKNFLRALHERSMESLKAQLDAEEWRGVATPRDLQAIVNRLLSARLATSRPRTAVNEGTNGASPVRRGARDLMISGQPFRVVNVLLPLLDFIERYLACAQQLALSFWCVPFLVQLLRLFNERSHHLVLGAGAIRTTSLTKIGSKTLAFVSHAISIILALLPAMENVLIGCLPRNSRQFEKDKTHIQTNLNDVKRELKSHREQILNKFVDMIEHKLDLCCGKEMRKVKWDERAAQDVKPEAYMTALTKAVKDLHTSLSKFLPPDHLQFVFGKIFELFNKRIPELYQGLHPETRVGVSQIRVDLRHLGHCLRLLPGTSGAGDTIDKLANELFGAAPKSDVVSPPEPPTTTVQSGSENREGVENGQSTT